MAKYADSVHLICNYPYIQNLNTCFSKKVAIENKQYSVLDIQKILNCKIIILRLEIPQERPSWYDALYARKIAIRAK